MTSETPSRGAVRLIVKTSGPLFGNGFLLGKGATLFLIAGVPGIGKTMLARMLMLHHMEQGYAAIVISSDVGEADRVYSGQEKQIFYYDDFLGTSFDEAALKNEDSRLARFMRAVSHASNKRLILTTREYILQDARMRYEKLFLAVTDIGGYGGGVCDGASPAVDDLADGHLVPAVQDSTSDARGVDFGALGADEEDSHEVAGREGASDEVGFVFS